MAFSSFFSKVHKGSHAALWRERLLVWLTITSSLTLVYAGVTNALDVSRVFGMGSTETFRTADSVITQESKIIIKGLNIESEIIFPEDADGELLKKALDQGVVHYPLSPAPGQAGNVLLFGHSSNKPAEKNPARTIFTKLNSLTLGEEVELLHGGRVYIYRVSTVRVLKPEEAEIYLTSAKRMLTLSTCWPPGNIANRFIVEAEFMRSYPLRSTYSAADSSS